MYGPLRLIAFWAIHSSLVQLYSCYVHRKVASGTARVKQFDKILRKISQGIFVRRL